MAANKDMVEELAAQLEVEELLEVLFFLERGNKSVELEILGVSFQDDMVKITVGEV